jgi:O-methyltransferase
MFWSAKQALKSVIERAGYTVLSTETGGHGHQRVYPHATYAPWSLDREFTSTFEEVRYHSHVDKYRCWELWKIVEQTAKLSAGECLEVGVWRGGSGCLIARRVELHGIASQVFLCDTFSGVAKAGPMDDRYKGGEHADTTESMVHNLARKLHLNVRVLKGVFPDDTGILLEKEMFRFCHVDVDVYESARATTEWIWPRLVSRGVIVYDDYGFAGCDGVRRFVDEWQSATDCVFVHNLNGHAIVIKT